MKRLIVLGSTGSIGRSAVEVVRGLCGRVRVVGLAASTRWQALAEQAAEFQPDAVALAEPAAAEHLRRALASGSGGDAAAGPAGGAGGRPAGVGGYRPRILAGPDAMTRLVRETPADMVLTAASGAAGLPATLESVRQGRDLAIANKEPLVMAGEIIVRHARRAGVNLLPVDSEHSAVFQALGRREARLPAGEPARGVRRIILTASGGPFRLKSLEEMARATVAEALDHPTWDMGPKITIDSATMINKALEVIEARWLFGVPAERIEVVIHPQSIVHSMVEYEGGSIVAQMSKPDMRVPIQYALTYPERVAGVARTFDVADFAHLTFEPVDTRRFPGLLLGYQAARAGGVAGAVLNGANEVANARFRAGEIAFTDIARVCAEVLDHHQTVPQPTLDDILAADQWARAAAAAWPGR
ncbi:MAG: 1-deoxy-D-xylulose-5-phosphate reductoisomerase [Planctomycetes bacterium]|nr:1-deoxy-D-xylulose-5-phosphate reductoisomerase [Planctomycetota bacterium]